MQLARLTLIFQVDGAANRHQYYYWLSQRHYIIKTYTSSCEKTKII